MRRATLALLLGGLGIAAAAPARAAAQSISVSVVKGPEEGRTAPDFSLPWATKDTIGAPEQPWSLYRTRGQVVVLAFYPRDFTTGCTAEWQAFRDQAADLFGDGVAVVGISVDSVETHQRFAQSLGLPFILLSDPSLKVIDKFGAKDKEYQIAKRMVYVIGKNGNVAYRDMRFRALEPKSYADLKKAVAAAVRAP